MSCDSQPSFLELFFRVAKQHRHKPAILVEGTTAYTYGQLLSKAYRIANAIDAAGIDPNNPVGSPFRSLGALDSLHYSGSPFRSLGALDSLHYADEPHANRVCEVVSGEATSGSADRSGKSATRLSTDCIACTDIGHVVGIGISKSADYIACMLGAWIAGAAFVPLDPALPKERAQFISNQSSLRAVFVKQTTKSAFATLGVEPLSVDDDWTDDFDFEAMRSKFATIPSERLAYIIYTSGSTGRPKGVMVTHSGIVNLLLEQIKAFKLDEQSRCLFILSTNFDASVSDIGTSLLAGSTLCIEPQGLLQPGPNFLPLLFERQITHMDIPPSLLKTIPCENAPATLQTIIIGGEACAPDTVRHWAKKCMVVNVYGPTEATVCTSLGVCDSETWDRPLIGQPLANVQYHLLDESLKPVYVGTPGELYISGIGLARGYVDEPELTAKKFITLDGQRLYRTGDLVVQCTDGEYQFLGRVDRQFKLRGMLIEPEEIESRLAIHKDIQMSAVLKRELRPGFPGEKLIAFVLPRKRDLGSEDIEVAGNALDAGDLRTHLLKYLPPWMVPQIFEFVDAMPMTITGKIDLSSLRNRALSTIPDLAPTVATTPTQEILLDVWKLVLGVESVGIHDDFYALGGDSLNIIEAVLASHVRGLTVSPDIFALHSTVSELSEIIDQKQDRQKHSKHHSETETEEVDDLSGNFLTSEFLREDVQLDRQFFAAAAAAALAPTSSASGNIINSSQNFNNNNNNNNNRPSKGLPPRMVLMTGTTGFLGAGLLYELLRKTDAQFYCLVRANSEHFAMARLRNALATHGKSFSTDDESRIHPVLGDLTKTSFGISADNWKKLTAEIDTVFHSAATVNMVKDYYELKGTNVDGTREIARFVLEGQPKHLHYSSTLSVFVATNHNTGIASESDKLDGSFEVYGGYAQTKFAAELLLRCVERNGFPISFYRFGLLTGDSKSGLSAKDDFLNFFARGLSTLGCVPISDDNVQVDITPIDYAIQAMAHIAVNGKNENNTYHIANEKGLPLSALVNALNRLGFGIKSMPAQDFLSVIKEKSGKLDSAESAACLALCRLLQDSGSFSEFRTMDLFQATDIRFDCSKTKAALAATSIQCPAPTVELIELYLQKALLEKTVIGLPAKYQSGNYLH